ncbi:hypothetical protein jaqu_35060 [Jannaschia aquimarina]|uniref:Uncharacterized protein n=1 Tax=Jannaschia aquimarina TaxID=935700 RepID=A0A0D1D3U5_9RHOB|nr:hypothetical protein jaqu_35060 [Jannaschia aquimarina]
MPDRGRAAGQVREVGQRGGDLVCCALVASGREGPVRQRRAAQDQRLVGGHDAPLLAREFADLFAHILELLVRHDGIDGRGQVRATREVLRRQQKVQHGEVGVELFLSTFVQIGRAVRIEVGAVEQGVEHRDRRIDEVEKLPQRGGVRDLFELGEDAVEQLSDRAQIDLHVPHRRDRAHAAVRIVGDTRLDHARNLRQDRKGRPRHGRGHRIGLDREAHPGAPLQCDLGDEATALRQVGRHHEVNVTFALRPLDAARLRRENAQFGLSLRTYVARDPENELGAAGG